MNIIDRYYKKIQADKRQAIIDDFISMMKGDPKKDKEGRPVAMYDAIYDESLPYRAESWHPIYQLIKAFGGESGDSKKGSDGREKFYAAANIARRVNELLSELDTINYEDMMSSTDAGKEQAIMSELAELREKKDQLNPKAWEMLSSMIGAPKDF